MSEVRANSITNASGTGAPDFPNGIEVSTGNVGIGTATPTDLVQVVGGNILIGTDSGDPFNSQSRVRIQGAGSEYIQIKGDGTGSLGLLFGDATDNFTAGVLSNQASGNDLRFQAGNAECMRIDSSGNVGIGTISPSTYGDLAVIGKTYSSTGYALTTDASNFTPSGVTNSVPNYGLGAPEASVVSLSGFESLRFYTQQIERARIDSAGTLQFNSGYGSVAPAYGCRAWVNFNGQGTVAIRASGNVSSVTDLGTGSYRVNFATAMPDANYAAVTGGQNDQGNNGYIVLTAGGMTASSVQVMSRREAGFGDGSLICVSIFR